MKYNMIKNAGVVLAFGLCATSCNDFLDEKPTSNIFPDVYFSDASHLEAYANNLYVDFLPSHTTAADYGIHGKDKDTETRSHTDGFRRNNANYWNKREICRFYLYSSIIWFCPVLEELGK